jgi:phage tail sheath gpL-like
VTIPSNLRAPFVAVEFDNTRASQGAALLAYKGLLIGQKTGQGTAAANTLHRVTSADAAATLAGRGSQLHRQALGWFQNNTFTETWIGVVDDNPAGVFATGTLTFTGPATAAGTLSLYVGGNLVSVGVASGDSANTIASNVATALGIHASGTVTFATATVGDDITIGATTFVATSGAVTPGAATYSIDTGNTEAAASLAAQVNAHAVASQVVWASSALAVCTLRSIAGGTAGNSIVLTSVDGVTTAVTGSGTLAGGGTDTDYPVYATVSSAVVTVRARNRGPQGNNIDLRLNYADGQETPAGVGCTISAMASGATAPTLTSLIAEMGDEWFQIIAHPYTDSTSLTALETELASRWGPMRMIDGMAFTGAAGSTSTLATLGNTRNSKHSVILAQDGANPLTPPLEFAAMVAGAVALEANADPARPFQTVPVVGALPPAQTDRFTLQERNLLLYDGIATTRTDPGGGVVIERLITTWQLNAAGSPDTSYLDVTTMLTLLYLRYSLRAKILAEHPRSKLMDDGARVGPGQAIITPQTGKALAVAWAREMETRGLVENVDQFKADLVCVRNGSDPNRLDWTISPDLVNGFIVGAVRNLFLL